MTQNVKKVYPKITYFLVKAIFRRFKWPRFPKFGLKSLLNNVEIFKIIKYAEIGEKIFRVKHPTLRVFHFHQIWKIKVLKKIPNFWHFWPTSIASCSFLVAKSVHNHKIKASGNEILLHFKYSTMTIRKFLADLRVILSTNSVIHHFSPFNDLMPRLSGRNSSKNHLHTINEGQIQLFSANQKFRMTLGKSLSSI